MSIEQDRVVFDLNFIHPDILLKELISHDVIESTTQFGDSFCYYHESEGDYPVVEYQAGLFDKDFDKLLDYYIEYDEDDEYWQELEERSLDLVDKLYDEAENDEDKEYVSHKYWEYENGLEFRYIFNRYKW